MTVREKILKMKEETDAQVASLLRRCDVWEKPSLGTWTRGQLQSEAVRLERTIEERVSLSDTLEDRLKLDAVWGEIDIREAMGV